MSDLKTTPLPDIGRACATVRAAVAAREAASDMAAALKRSNDAIGEMCRALDRLLSAPLGETADYHEQFRRDMAAIREGLSNVE